MRWFDGSDDDDLEPLDPDTGDPLDPAGSAHAQADVPAPVRRQPSRAGRRAFRLYALAGSLGLLSLLQLVGAVHVRNVERDLRHVEKVWRTAVAIDRDRAEAEAALQDAARRYGYTRALTDQRRAVLRAEEARLEKLERELFDEHVATSLGRSLRDAANEAFAARRRQLARRYVPPLDATFDDVSERLSSALARWRLDERRPQDAALTAARETIERVSHFADEPTGLVLAGVSAKGLVVVDVDAEEIGLHAVDLDPGVAWRGIVVRSIGNVVLVHAGEVVNAIRVDGVDAVRPLWTRPADALETTEDGYVWIQHGTDLVRVGRDGNDAGKRVRLGRGRWLGGATGSDAVIFSQGDDVDTIAPDGGPGAEVSRYGLHSHDATHVWTTTPHGEWLVGLADGRVLLARAGVRPMRLRAPIPRLFGVAAVDG